MSVSIITNATSAILCFMNAMELRPNALPFKQDSKQCILNCNCDFITSFLQGKPAHCPARSLKYSFSHPCSHSSSSLHPFEISIFN